MRFKLFYELFSWYNIVTMIKQSDLKEIRKNNGLTQLEMSKLLHCTSRMYQYYESQTRIIPIALIELLEFKLLKKDNI